MATVEIHQFPVCRCGGVIVPFTDEGRQSQVIIKAWVCFECGKNITMRSGELQKVEIVEVPKPVR